MPDQAQVPIPFKTMVARIVLSRSAFDSLLAPAPEPSRWQKIKWRIRSWRHAVCCHHED